MLPQKPIFRFNRQERSGLLALLFLIFLLQLLFYYVTQREAEKSDFSPYPDKGFEALHGKVAPDSLPVSRYKADPNQLSDFRGYSWGMSLQEIDRLHRYRAAGGILHSADQFRKVTGINDSLFAILTPLLRFPARHSPPMYREEGHVDTNADKDKVPVGDLNKVTAAELRRIRGIGPVLSGRIVKFRDLLGGFSVDGQLDEVYGLDPEVAKRVRSRYRVLSPPGIRKLDVNTASAEELARNVYISYALARAIVRYREENGGIDSFDEISGLKGVTSGGIERIKLYLKL